MKKRKKIREIYRPVIELETKGIYKFKPLAIATAWTRFILKCKKVQRIDMVINCGYKDMDAGQYIMYTIPKFKVV